MSNKTAMALQIFVVQVEIMLGSLAQSKEQLEQWKQLITNAKDLKAALEEEIK